jgi:hypothetical protein
MWYMVIDLKILLSEGSEDDTPNCKNGICSEFGCLKDQAQWKYPDVNFNDLPCGKS